MLFKQWNEESEPRHILDEHFQTTPSLFQVKELPKFSSLDHAFLKDIQHEDSYLLLAPKRLKTLFVGFATKPAHILTGSYDSQEYTFPIYSSNYINSGIKEMNKTCHVMIVDEKYPVIVLNFLSSILSSHIDNPSTVILGLGDRISSFKNIALSSPSTSSSTEKESSDFVPPEFVSNFAASIFHKCKASNFWFLPSEGPIGFEKISQQHIDELIILVTSFFKITDPSFSQTFSKNWNENDGTHVNTLYL